MNSILVERLETVVLNTYLKAQEVYRRNFTLPTITFGDMGKVSGMAYLQSNKLKFSPTLFVQNVETFLSNTVPHEVAHLVTWQVYPNSKQGHGPEWRSVMSQLGVENISRCHSYDVSTVASVLPRPFVYKCNCQSHKLTSIIHRRITAGQKRRCKRCMTHIVYVGRVA